MFLDDNDQAQTGRTNDDLNQRDDDLMYSQTFKSKAIPYQEEHTDSNPYRNMSKRSHLTANSKHYKSKNSQESLFDRESQA